MLDIEIVDVGRTYLCIVNGEVAMEGTERACEKFANELYEQAEASWETNTLNHNI